MRKLILIAHNVRSTHNVGSLLRTADGLGVERFYMTGYTPYPLAGGNDSRLPHEAASVNQRITKTALGAEQSVDWRHESDVRTLLTSLKSRGYALAALEQATGSVNLDDFLPPERLALLVGREVEGLESEILAACDHILEIPMFGRKESFNVSVAAAMALYHLRFDS